MLEKLNIVRDCYWAMPSGDTYIIDSEGKLSSDRHGFYPKFNANDSDYIRVNNSGEINYYGKLTTSNLNTDAVYTQIRAECIPPGSAVININGMDMGSIPVSTLANSENNIELSNTQQERIHFGRVDKNYDYVNIKVGSANAVNPEFIAPYVWMMADSGVSPCIDEDRSHAQTYMSWGSGDIQNGDNVRVWESYGTYEYFGDPLTFSQNVAGGTNTPTYHTNVVGGKPALRFRRPDKYLISEFLGSILNGENGAIYVVCQMESHEDEGTGLLYTDGNYLFSKSTKFDISSDSFGGVSILDFNDSRQPFWIVRTGFSNYDWARSLEEFPSGEFVSFATTKNADSNVAMSFDGSGLAMERTVDAWWANQRSASTRWNLCIGGKYYQGAFANAFDGYIAEILVYNNALTTNQKAGVENYIYNKYGVSTYTSEQNVKLYNVNVYYSGDRTWDNHQTGLPNVVTETHYPTSITYPMGMGWSGDVSRINTGIDAPTCDDTVLVNNYSNRYVQHWQHGANMPSGSIGIGFENHVNASADPFTRVTRAVMKLRMGLPIVSGDNTKDSFEINGYNTLYKDGDNTSELTNVVSSIQKPASKYGYYLYGAGDIIEASGFTTYNTELNFIDPANTQIDSIYHANIDMLANMNFYLVGLPSGTQISAAELQIEYLNDKVLPLYTAGSKRLYRCPASSVVDAGTLNSFYGGFGGWHHRGWRILGPTVIEQETFDNFYTFSEGANHTRTYPELAKAYYYPTEDRDLLVYGDYVETCPQGTVGDDADVTSLLKDPQRRNYYRNAISASDLTPEYEPTLRDISSFKPRYYRDMIYHGASLAYVDVDTSDGDATALDTDDLCQVYFEDRLGITESFTLYFMIYRDYGFQSYGRFFHRGVTAADDIENDYEIVGDLLTNGVRFTIKGSNGSDNSIEVEINQFTREPILIWFTCEGTEDTGYSYSRLKLYVHQNIKNYFNNDWISNSKTMSGDRKMFSPTKVRTALGTLHNLDVYEQMSRRLYLHHASLVEFGYANRRISLDHETSSDSVQELYDVSTDDDKKFFSSRVTNNQFLQPNPSGVRWVVPRGSGEAKWATNYNMYRSWSPSGIHSVYNPVSTAGTNALVHPSSIYAEIELAHSTDHPSGVNIWVDIEFDTGSVDNWKVAHIPFNGLPSGGADYASYSPITYKAGVGQHINMDDGPIRWSDITNVNARITTQYVGIDRDNYSGTVEIRSLQVFLDSYCIAATGLADLDLYTFGGATTLNEPRLDLYMESNLSETNELDLYTYGTSVHESGNIPLYTKAEQGPLPQPDDPNATIMPLYVLGQPGYGASGDMSLFTWATTTPAIRKFANLYINSTFDPKYRLPLFIDAGTADANASMDLYIKNWPWHSAAPSSVPLFIQAPHPTTNNMSLYTTTPSGTDGAYVGRGSMNLYIDRDTEATASRLALYMAQNTTINSTNLFIEGTSIQSSSIPFYIRGSGDFGKELKLYTHGF